MAEALLSAQLRGTPVTLASAGTHALLGRPADEHVLELLAERGIDASTHRARQVRLADLRWADLVLVMDRRNLIAINEVDPAVRGKSFLTGHWLGQREIADPYRQGRAAFERTLAELDDALGAWLLKL